MGAMRAPFGGPMKLNLQIGGTVLAFKDI